MPETEILPRMARMVRSEIVRDDHAVASVAVSVPSM